MQLEHIRLFHLAASLGSISKAAQAAHISQPALSQQIQRLEQELGFTLFERSNRGVLLTPAGQIMEKYADRFVALHDNLTEDLSQLEQNNRIVRVAATPVVGIYGLPCTIYKVKEKFPQHVFNLTTIPSIEVESRVIKGESDIGFINGPPSSPEEFVAKKVISDKLVVAAGSSFKNVKATSMDELRQYPLVMLSAQSSLRKQLERYLEEHNHPIDSYQVLFHLDSAESVKSSVIQGHGLAFLPYMSIKKELYQKQLRLIDIKDFDMSYDIYVIYKKHQDTTDAFYQISVYFSKIVSETFC